MSQENKNFSTESLPFFARLSILYAEDFSNKWITYILRAFSLIQALSLILANIDMVIPGLPQVSLIKVRDYVSLIALLQFFEDPSSILLVLIVISIYFLSLLVMTVIHCSWALSGSNKLTYTKLASGLTTFHLEILFYPITLFLLELIVSTFNNQFEAPMLGREATITLSIILLVPNFLITFCKILFCYNPIRSKKFISRKNNIHLLALAILKVCLAILQTLSADRDGDNRSNNQQEIVQIMTVVISLVISTTSLISTHITLPEYRNNILKLHIIYEALATGISICQAAALFFSDKTLILQITLGLIPFWVKVRLTMLRYKMLKLTFYSEEHKPSLNEMAHLETLFKQLKIDLIIVPAKKKFVNKTLKAKWLMYSHLKEGNTTTVHEETIKFKNAYKLFLKETFEKMLDMKSNNIYVLFIYCNIILKHFKMFPKSYHICLRLKKTRLRIPYQIALYETMSKLHSNMQQYSAEVQQKKRTSDAMWKNRVIEEAFEDFKQNINTYTKHAVEFWKLLVKEDPDIGMLYKKGKQAQVQEAKIQNIWDRNAHEFGQNYPIAYLLYGMFKAEMLNFPRQGKIMVERYEWLIKNKVYNDDFIKLEEFKDATIIVSGERNQLGTIIECSKSISQMFGMDRASLVGKNVKMIMPHFFQDKHDKFMLQYYETGKGKLMNTAYRLYGKDHEGNIFPISLTLSIHFDYQKGVVYTGLMKKIIDSNEYMFVRSDFIVQEMSPNIRKQLGIELYSNTNILEVCPSFKYFEHKDNTLEALPTSDLTQNSRNRNEVFAPKLKSGVVATFFPRRRILTNELHSDQTYTYKVDLHSYSFQNSKINVLTLEIPEENHVQNGLVDNDNETNQQYSIMRAKPGPEKTHFSDEISSEGPEGKPVPQRPIYVKTKNVNNEPTLSSNLLSVQGLSAQMLSAQMLSFQEPAKFPDAIVKSQINDSTPQDRSSKEKPTITNTQEQSKEVHVSNYFRDARFSVASVSSSASSKSQQRQAIDHIQTIYSKSRPDNLRSGLTVMFTLLLAASLLTSGIEHIVFNSSVENIDFSVDVIKTSYERLDSLIFCWRFVLVYQTRINKMYPIVMSDLDRYKTVVIYYQNIMKNSNNQLANLMSNALKNEQKFVFEKTINFKINETNGELRVTTLNSFDAFNVMVDKLSVFYKKSHETLLLGKNPEVDFILTNSVNDLLITSERIVRFFGESLLQLVHTQGDLLNFISIVNIVLMAFAGLITLFNFRNNYNKHKRLFQAMMSIQTDDIDHLTVRLNSFGKALLDKEENQYVQKISKVCSMPRKHVKKLMRQKQFSRRFDDREIFQIKLKQTILIVLLLGCFVGLYFYRSTTAIDSFDELVLTNNRLVVVSKARYLYNLVIGTGQYLLGFQNTTLMRNEPADGQMRSNLNEIISNQYLTDTFVDSDTKEFIDPFIEMLFKNKLCPYLPDFPGTSILTNCLKATQNETIGLYAVNMKYYEELDSYLRDFQRNNTYAQAKKLFSDLTTNSVPKFYVTVGAYIVLIDMMTKTFKNQVSYFLANELKNFIWELTLMSFLAILSVWYLVKKANSDEVIRTLLRMIPYEETIKNKLLKNVVINFYRGKLNYLRQLT